METSSGESTPKKHTRTVSGRASMPRRSTRGPLDITQAPVTNPVPVSPAASQITSPRTPSASNSLLIPTASLKSFPSLLRPELYHPLTSLTTAPPFRTSPHQATSTASLKDLLHTGHFRAAAITAATALTSPDLSPTDHTQIFALFYIRLAALTLAGSNALAAQESTALEDLNSSIYRDDSSGEHLVPWELRVLAVRLQGTGFNDPRKGIMGYYDLARDARATILKLKAGELSSEADEDGEERAMWEARLRDLGVRVASQLVEMEDLEGAARHLATLPDEGTSEELGLQKALLWLKIGNLEAARRCAGQDNGLIQALGDMAEGEYVNAVRSWEKLCENDKSNALYEQNLAVCLLYAGRLDEARSVLEKLVDDGHVFNAVTFNLSTIYELCTDRSRALKIGLAEQAAGLDPEGQRGTGWEKSLLDFKL